MQSRAPKPDRTKYWLTFCAHRILAKYQPLVVGVTGSVGKTSTRHAIAAMLSAKYELREPIRNYNNNIGIPLTIIGATGLDERPKVLSGRLGWLWIFVRALYVWLTPQTYPRVLVLEYGIHNPGDMDDLLQIVKPDIAVLTTIGISHQELFQTKADIAAEKGKLVAALTGSGILVYNIDDPNVAEQARKTDARKVSFGTDEAGNAPDVVLAQVDETLAYPAETTLHVKTPTRQVRVTVPVLGTGHQQAIVAAVAVAEAMEVETAVAVRGLSTYRPVAGRLTVLPGINQSIVIDDSYNAAPASVMAGLRLLARLPNQHKMAALGDMLELGDETDGAHREVGELVASLNLAKLFTVGELGRRIGAAARVNGMPAEQIASFANSDQAKAEVVRLLQADSVIFVKGSEGSRMERISKEVLAEPSSAARYLPRQYGKWLVS